MKEVDVAFEIDRLRSTAKGAHEGDVRGGIIRRVPANETKDEWGGEQERMN